MKKTNQEAHPSKLPRKEYLRIIYSTANIKFQIKAQAIRNINSHYAAMDQWIMMAKMPPCIRNY